MSCYSQGVCKSSDSSVQNARAVCMLSLTCQHTCFHFHFGQHNVFIKLVRACVCARVHECVVLSDPDLFVLALLSRIIIIASADSPCKAAFFHGHMTAVTLSVFTISMSPVSHKSLYFLGDSSSLYALIIILWSSLSVFTVEMFILCLLGPPHCHTASPAPLPLCCHIILSASLCAGASSLSSVCSNIIS